MSFDVFDFFATDLSLVYRSLTFLVTRYGDLDFGIIDYLNSSLLDLPRFFLSVELLCLVCAICNILIFSSSADRCSSITVRPVDYPMHKAKLEPHDS